MRLTHERARQLSEVYEKILDHYGDSKFQDWTPELTVYHDDTRMHLMGEWSDFFEGADVSVNLAPCRNMREAVTYIIHEYAHHLQSPTWYTRYCDIYTYWEHPYEIQAQEIAERDVGLFWPPGE